MVIARAAATVARPVAALAFRPRVSCHAGLPTGGCIVAANHLSGLDSLALAYALRPRLFRSMAKNDLFRGSLSARLVRSLGAFPARDEGTLPGGVSVAVALAAAGEAVAIFPEGARRRGQVRRPRHGAARAALLGGVPLVPVAIAGTDGWRGRCRWYVVVGAPVDLGDLRAEHGERAVQEATRRLWEAIRALEAGLVAEDAAA